MIYLAIDGMENEFQNEVNKINGEYIYGINDLFALIIILKRFFEKRN